MQKPPPVHHVLPSGEPVIPRLVDWLIHDLVGALPSEQIVDLNMQLMDRYHYDMSLKSISLTTKDDQDEILGARNAALELLQYIYKAKLNKRLDEVKRELTPAVVGAVGLLGLSIVTKHPPQPQPPLYFDIDETEYPAFLRAPHTQSSDNKEEQP